ncbi:hypothetical protein BGZ65_007105, partial [Modicella reniformis]
MDSPIDENMCMRNDQHDITRSWSSSRSSVLPKVLSQWQPPASSIPLAKLQSALAHRFLRWAVSENLIQKDVSSHFKTTEEEEQRPPREQEEEEKRSSSSLQPQDKVLIDIDQSSSLQLQQLLETEAQADAIAETIKIQRSIESAGQDWAAAHDLVWPEGDYYMAEKISVREGVAHLKRGRRYIFVEPVLGLAAPYLYPPKCTGGGGGDEDSISRMDEDNDVEIQATRTERTPVVDNENGTDMAVSGSAGGSEQQQQQGHELDQEKEQDLNDDKEDTNEDDPQSSSSTSSSSSSSSVSASASSSWTEGFEPYSSLLDPSTD